MFEIGDLVVPVQKWRRRPTAPRIGIIVDAENHARGVFYTVHFLRADYATVGWEEHMLQRYTEGVQSAA
jgi:hypothetical protein